MKQKNKRIVIKIGSSTLVDEACNIKGEWLSAFARQVSELKSYGWQVVVVSSGAIACGLRTLDIKKRPDDLPSLQAAASVGQCAFSVAWASAFSEYNITTGNVLLTRRDTADRFAYLHARDTLDRLLDLGVVPIINENDTVSVEQIKFGDNDTLAALVSCLIDADLCVILSDIEGLYDKNPQHYSDAKLIERVEHITPEIMAGATNTGSSIGSGGMTTKLNAARVLMAAGICVVVAHGEQILNSESNRTDDPSDESNRADEQSNESSRSDGQSTNADFLLRCINDDVTGATFFSPHAQAHAITPKKLWIALGDTTQGYVVIDSGAQNALQNKGSSLLAVGVKGVYGTFDSESIIDVKNENQEVIARGRVSFSSDEISLACGRTSAQLSANRLLEPLSMRPVIHRDELMVF